MHLGSCVGPIVTIQKIHTNNLNGEWEYVNRQRSTNTGIQDKHGVNTKLITLKKNQL